MVRPANRPYAEVRDEWSREVQHLMSLRHPNVVYIFGAFENGHVFYFALDRQLLAAIQFLHDNDVVHDDLHPGNVLLVHARDPHWQDSASVKLSDFGISRE